jgi:hypothetical protein
MFSLEPSLAILFLVVPVISKPLSRYKFRYREKRRQKILFYNKQTEIVDLITL